LAPTPDGLVNENFPPHIWLGFLNEVKIIHTTEGQKKEEIKKIYGKMTILNLDLPDYWRWVKGYRFFFTNLYPKIWKRLYHQQDLENLVYTCGGQMARLSPKEP
jgi:hypothetical protein